MAVSRQNVYKKSSKVYTGNVTLRLRPCDQLCQAFLFVYFLYKRARKQSLSSVIKSICLETTELHRFFLLLAISDQPLGEHDFGLFIS